MDTSISLGHGYQLKPIIYEAFFNGEKIKLTDKERILLQLLGTHIGQVITFEQIIEAVWEGKGATENNARTLVWRLRGKLPVDIIKNSSSYGYYIGDEQL